MVFNDPNRMKQVEDAGRNLSSPGVIQERRSKIRSASWLKVVVLATPVVLLIAAVIWASSL